MSNQDLIDYLKSIQMTNSYTIDQYTMQIERMEEDNIKIEEILAFIPVDQKE